MKKFMEGDRHPGRGNTGALSHVRIFVENAIAGIKRFNILMHAFRNRWTNMEDDVIALCAGLENFLLL